MYPKYFGLKEPSFSIAPDPHYLFLSEQHKEALAHLLYGAGESGGFVLLTGEVGTGKTTVCRAFLERLPEGVDVALIVNPAMTANELLLNICDEFRIPVPAGERSVKLLVDRLNGFLLEAHAKGRRPVLMIDEAQNLRPKVMEQIRLLTNLETTKHKLLQIFLVGQPELRRVLEREGLRQINQRITARFHLRPFTLTETGDYICHRVAVAGVDRPLFTGAAIRRIHRLTGGVPRLVNILCDRSLLGACVTRANQVTPAIVSKAAREVQGDMRSAVPTPAPAVRPAFAIAAVLALMVAAGWLAYTGSGGDPRERIAGWFPDVTPIAPAMVPDGAQGRAAIAGDGRRASGSAPAADPSPEPLAEPVTVQSAALEPARDPPSSPQTPSTPSTPPGEASPLIAGEQPRIALAKLTPQPPGERPGAIAMPESLALTVLLRRWGISVQDLGSGDPCGRVAVFGLRCEREQGKLSHVRFYDRPVLLRVTDQGGSRRYAVLGRLDASNATLDLVEGNRVIPIPDLEAMWTGDYTVVWQPPSTGANVIGGGASTESVQWLRGLLAQIPEGGGIDLNSGVFDQPLSAAVRAFQSSRGLFPDGIAGPRTLVQLHNVLNTPGIPRLMDSGETGLAKDPAAAVATVTGAP